MAYTCTRVDPQRYSPNGIAGKRVKSRDTHPVAQLVQQDNPVTKPPQATHRPLSPRTHSFHTIYDGEGKRVKKVSSTETTIFVYDASSRVVAEYSTATASTPQVSYLTQDHLGSQRVVTNENGAVTDRKDFAAFGEETTASRTSGIGYTTAEDPRPDYTGYEKDSESGLEFAQARFYNPIHGRYTSVDPLASSLELKNPQTFNRYTYVLNSPYKFADPLGLVASSAGCSAEFDRCDEQSGNMSLGEADYVLRLDTIIQTETRTYTVVQTENDGHQATITVTSQVTRTIDRTTQRQIGPDSNPVVSANSLNTGRALFSQADLQTMANVASDIVYVGLKTGRDPQLFLAMAQRETHLGIGSIGDPRNKGKPEMVTYVNPLQLDGDANKKYWASPTDRQYNIEYSMKLFQENFVASRAKTTIEGLSYYNSGRRTGSSKGASYAAEIMAKTAAIKVSISFQSKKLFF